MEADGWIVPWCFKDFWAHVSLNLLPRKLLIIFCWFFQKFWFSLGQHWLILNSWEKIKAGFNLVRTYSALCQWKFYFVSSCVLKEYLSLLCVLVISKLRILHVLSSCAWLARGIQGLSGSFFFLIWRGPCIHRLGRRCNVAWAQNVPKFWGNFYPFCPEILLILRLKIGMKSWKN